MTEDEIIDMQSRLKAHDLSLDDRMGDLSRESFAETLPDDAPDQEVVLSNFEEQQQLKNWADQAMETLSPREKFIMRTQGLGR